MANHILSINDNRVLKLRKTDCRFDEVCKKVGDISYHLYEDRYEFFVETFIGQMLSNKASETIVSRLRNLCHGEIMPENIDILFDDEIREIGVSAQKLNYIRKLTESVLSGVVDFNYIDSLEEQQAYNELLKIRGVGKWSAKMYLLFVLDKENILPIEDVAFLQGYEWMSGTRNIDTLIKDSEKWQPYCSLVARFLYKALDGGFTRKKLNSVDNSIL